MKNKRIIVVLITILAIMLSMECSVFASESNVATQPKGIIENNTNISQDSINIPSVFYGTTRIKVTKDPNSISGTVWIDWSITANKIITGYDLLLEIDGWETLNFSSRDGISLSTHNQSHCWIGNGEHTITLVGQIYTYDGHANIYHTMNYSN